jgi:hypothetical protein
VEERLVWKRGARAETEGMKEVEQDARLGATTTVCFGGQKNRGREERKLLGLEVIQRREMSWVVLVFG